MYFFQFGCLPQRVQKQHQRSLHWRSIELQKTYIMTNSVDCFSRDILFNERPHQQRQKEPKMEILQLSLIVLFLNMFEYIDILPASIVDCENIFSGKTTPA